MDGGREFPLPAEVFREFQKRMVLRKRQIERIYEAAWKIITNCGRGYHAGGGSDRLCDAGSTFAAVLVLILIVGAAAVLLSGDFGEQFAQKYRSDLEREEDEETDPIMRVITAVPLDENPVELEKADNDSNNEAADSIPKENTEPVKSLTEKEPAVRRQ